MTITETREKVLKIQDRMNEIHGERNALAKELMANLGTDTSHGINLDNLSAFARKVIPLNQEFEQLSEKHTALIGEILKSR